MGEELVTTKLIKFSVSGKRILCWSIFAIEPIADFCPFLGYWPSKNWPRDHVVVGEFVSLAKTITFGNTGKRVSCWSIIAIEAIFDFSLFLGEWPLKIGSRDHDVKV